MRTARQYVLLIGMFLVVPLAALLVVPSVPSGYRAFQDQNDPTSPIVFIILVVGMTGAMLVLIKRARRGLLKALLMGALGVGLFSIGSLFLLLAGQGEAFSLGFGIALAAGVLTLMYKYPRWYVVNAAGLIIGAGAALVLGITLGILPSLILLTVMAMYDAISVYVTKHMLTLAEGVGDLGLPIVLVVPGRHGTGLAKLDLKDRSKDAEREMMLMGLGDVIIPSVLVVSAAANLSPVSGAGWPWPAMSVALLTLVAVTIGLAALMLLISKGRPQAGLPFLNGSAIIGYALSYLLVYQDLGFGFA